MKMNEVRVGGHYSAKVGGKLTTVRVDAIRKIEKYVGLASSGMKSTMTRWDCTNLTTRKKVVFKSAMKFLREVPAPGTAEALSRSLDRQMNITASDRRKDASQTVSPAATNGEKGLKVETVTDPDGFQYTRPVDWALVQAELFGPEDVEELVHSTAVADRLLLEERAAKSVPLEEQLAASPTAKANEASWNNLPDRGTRSGAMKLADKLRQEKPTVPGSAQHLQVKALAGTGKTTTAVEGLKVVKGVGTSLTPSPQQAAVWEQLGLGKSDSVRLSSFNTSITDVLKAKVAESGLDKRGVEARGIHSLGLGAVTKAFGRMDASEYAVRDMLCENILGRPHREVKKDATMATLVTAVDELVGLCKQTLTEPEDDNLDRLCSHYDVETNGSRGRVYDLTRQCLEMSKSPSGRIHFDDMVWLPVIHNLPIYKVDVQVVDESQDLNRMQQQLMYRAGRRIVFIGDPHQAIYGFAGADADSMDRMGRELAATPMGLRTLPLTVTRRCGKAIVEEAKVIVPEYEAHESNGPGIVRHAKYPIQGFAGSRTELPWDKSYCADVRPGDFLLCRVNAPLVGQCFRFLKRGIKANIRGRKIGAGLISTIENLRCGTIPQLVGKVEDWLRAETAKEEAKRNPSEARIISLQDKADCIVCFTEGAQTIRDVVGKINSVFTDDANNPGVLLSSIHKAKGLEAERVFFLQPEGARCPHPMAKSAWQQVQEMNLRYVAITRAIKELVHVT